MKIMYQDPLRKEVICLDARDMKLNCLHLAANLLGANNHAALAQNSAKKPTAEEVTEAAKKLYAWIKE